MVLVNNSRCFCLFDWDYLLEIIICKFLLLILGKGYMEEFNFFNCNIKK